MSTTMGNNPLEKNGVAIIVNKRVQNTVFGCNLKNDRMISIHFQGKKNCRTNINRKETLEPTKKVSQHTSQKSH